MGQQEDYENDKQLNIAVIGHKRIPSREGGVEVVAEELATRMARDGNLVTVYNRKGHHVSGKEFSCSIDNEKNQFYKGIRVIPVFTIEKKGLAALSSSFFATIKALFGHYDVIHYHAEGPAVMAVIPHLFRIKTVVTIHGLDWNRAKWGRFAKKYLKLGEWIAAKYADAVIVLSKNVQQYFSNTYRRETIFIPNGIARPEKRPAKQIKEKWHLEKNSYILYLGRIVPEKGLQYLIAAYKRLSTEKKLVIAGGASDTDQFMQEIRQSAQEDNGIVFTGFVQGQTLEELYSNAYLYVLPSDLEGMPLSLLEAMSYGNCCVVSDIPECTEVVEDKAIVFRRGNVEDLGEKLKTLCDDTRIVEDYAAPAADFIIKKYDWDGVARMTLAVYHGAALDQPSKNATETPVASSLK